MSARAASVLGLISLAIAAMIFMACTGDDDNSTPTTVVGETTSTPVTSSEDGSMSQAQFQQLLEAVMESLAADQPSYSSGSGMVASGGACKLDKVGTWSEGNAPYRIEVSGHGRQHLDVYPIPGVPSISFVVPPIPNPEGVPTVVFGYGSLWEGNGPGCDDFDWKADATQYANARLDSGHSGLVIEWGSWNVLANLAGYSEQQIFDLLNQLFQNQGVSPSMGYQPSDTQPGTFGPQADANLGQSDLDQMVTAIILALQEQGLLSKTQPSAPVYQAPAVTAPAPKPSPTAAPSKPAATASSCSTTTQSHVPVLNEDWNIGTGAHALVVIWSNDHSNNLGDHKILIGANDVKRSFESGGGTVKYYPGTNACGAQAVAEYNDDKLYPYPTITMAQYDAYIATGKLP